MLERSSSSSDEDLLAETRVSHLQARYESGVGALMMGDK